MTTNIRHAASTELLPELTRLGEHDAIPYYGNLIGGKPRPAVDEAVMASTNPARPTQILGYVPASGAADIEAAVAAAHAAFPGWRDTPAPQRGQILARIAERLHAHRDGLGRLVSREMGKVYDEARGYDVRGAAALAEYMSGEGRRFTGVTSPSETPGRMGFTLREPIGVVGLITPWNLPVLTPGQKIIGAIMCGNTVVLKPAEDTPLTALLLAEIFQEAGVPDGVVNVVTGRGGEAGQALVAHPGVDMISFTGSTAAGRTIGGVAGSLLKRVSLELGGKNAIVVLDDADVQLAVDGAVWGGYASNGQRCTASSRIVVDRRVAAEFTDSFVARVRALRVGDPLIEGVQVGPLVNQAALDKVDSYTRIGLSQGAELLTGGRPVPDAAGGYYYQPTVLGNVAPTDRVAQEEIFGPTVSITVVDDEDEALQVANGTEYGLSMAVYTRDASRGLAWVHRMEAGMVYLNAPTIGAEVQFPFGGIKNTGNGHRETGPSVIEQFTEVKSVYLDYSGQLQRTGFTLD
ncbi:aldehyde dehydrogenase family protein [Nocardia sp. CA-128927]|uniref:aldehyde dehydrogenase family protein n=1 Tax=Nocardia sp. CA-128927 TaxID=3239975 RepID=UPI003D95F8DB